MRSPIGSVYLPEQAPFWTGRMGTTQHPAPESAFCWVDPRRVLLAMAGTESVIHDTSNSPGQGVAPIEGLVDFAERLAFERGATQGLAKLFGPLDPGQCFIDVEGWDIPTGGLFRIYANGNHRLTALAALGVPCVLAEVAWQRGPYATTATTNDEDDRVIGAYRRLLHTFQAATFPDISFDFTHISSDWPILLSTAESAVRSLAAVEQLTSTHYTGTIGRLPSPSFRANGWWVAVSPCVAGVVVPAVV
jgi:hypothetical protein